MYKTVIETKVIRITHVVSFKCGERQSAKLLKDWLSKVPDGATIFSISDNDDDYWEIAFVEEYQDAPF